MFIWFTSISDQFLAATKLFIAWISLSWKWLNERKEKRFFTNIEHRLVSSGKDTAKPGVDVLKLFFFVSDSWAK
jgi:hypothetical protein